MSSTLDLLAAVRGSAGAWRWEPGLDPDAVARALGTTVSTAPILYSGHPRIAGTLRVAGLPWPAWAAWREDGELLLIEVPEPPDAPGVTGAVEALGEPDARLDRARGPYPGAEQLAWLGRGITLFAWADRPPAALWLYQPTDLARYADELGALLSPTRPPR